jgi:hypothetical protein
MPDLSDAVDDLERLVGSLGQTTDAVLTTLAKRAVVDVRAAWPEDSGDSKRGWTASGPSIVNPVPYTTDVHDGLAFTLVPDSIENHITRALDELDDALGAA